MKSHQCVIIIAEVWQNMKYEAQTSWDLKFDTSDLVNIDHVI